MRSDKSFLGSFLLAITFYIMCEFWPVQPIENKRAGLLGKSVGWNALFNICPVIMTGVIPSTEICFKKQLC